MTKKLTQNILAPTDFSQASSLALDAAHILAVQNEAKITLVHVYDSGGVLFGGEGALESGHTIDEETEERIHGELKKIADERFADVAHVKTAVVISASAADGIVSYAEKEGVDMIVMSTHGRTGLKRMVIGSVAERVVRHANCPVLTLRSKVGD